MPTSIKITMKDGTVRDFPHEGRAGGSWTKMIRYEHTFVAVIDEWSNETVIPACDIREVKIDHGRGGW